MAAVWDQCCKPGVEWQGTTAGKVGGIAGLDAYIAEPKEKPTAAILLITDIFGWEVKNVRIVADKYADAGYLAVIPDFFHGDSVKNKDLSGLAAWLAKHPHEKRFPETQAVVAELRSKYGVKSVGAEGFCWGGHYVVALLGTGEIDVGVIAHGSIIKEEDVEAIKKPVLFLYSDNDRQIPTELREKFQAILKTKSFPTEGVFYPGQEHGWSLKGDDKDEKVSAAARDAFERALGWFKKHL